MLQARGLSLWAKNREFSDWLIFLVSLGSMQKNENLVSLFNSICNQQLVDSEKSCENKNIHHDLFGGGRFAALLGAFDQNRPFARDLFGEYGVGYSILVFFHVASESFLYVPFCIHYHRTAILAS